MAADWDDLDAQLQDIDTVARSVRETLLANLAFVGEIPAPTFGEARRVGFLRDRFTECGLANISEDEVGNGIGIIEGTEGEDTIVLVAHTDTIFSAKVDHALTILPDRVIGPGVGDNSLGVAMLASMPTLLDKLGYRFKSNLMLMGASRGLGRGNLEGLRFLLDHWKQPIRAGVCIEGVQLGRLSYHSIGMLRGEIVCTVPEEYDWTRFGAQSAIRTMNDVINRIDAIRLPSKPRTSIVFGSIQGGTSFNTLAVRSSLSFEIRSEDNSVANEIAQELRWITEEVSSKTRAEVTLDIFAERRQGGIPYKHPLVQFADGIMQKLGVEPHIAPSTSELAAFIDHEIPAVTLGLTEGERGHGEKEFILLEPLERGIVQLVATLIAIDRGICNEH